MLPPPHPAPEPDPAPQTLYHVERNLKIAAFATWAAEGKPRCPLRSVIGPPGSGKTAFLHELVAYLTEQPLTFVFPVFILKAVGGESLGSWYQRVTDSAVARGFYRLSPERWVSAGAGEIMEDVTTLCVGCGAHTLIIPVDAWDEASPSQREETAQFLRVALKWPNTRIVLTRRDEYALKDALMRWGQEVLQLEPLLSPDKQIELRLQYGAPGTAAWPQDELEDDLDKRIVTLDEAKRAAHLATLLPVLTPNPYVNLLLLNRVMLGATSLGPDDFRDCLKDYLQRAGLPVDPYVHTLLACGHDADFCETGRYPLLAPELSRSDDPTLMSLLEAGVVAYKGREGYFVELGVVALIRSYHSKTRPLATTQGEEVP